MRQFFLLTVVILTALTIFHASSKTAAGGGQEWHADYDAYKHCVRAHYDDFIAHRRELAILLANMTDEMHMLASTTNARNLPQTTLENPLSEEARAFQRHNKGLLAEGMTLIACKTSTAEMATLERLLQKHIVFSMIEQNAFNREVFAHLEVSRARHWLSQDSGNAELLSHYLEKSEKLYELLHDYQRAFHVNNDASREYFDESWKLIDFRYK